MSLNLIFKADGTTLINTLSEIKAEIKSTTEQIQSATNKVDLTALNTKYAELLEKQKLIKSVGISDEFNKTAQAVDKSTKVIDKAATSAKQSRIALTNLSLVAQDLPFGFIGIQNNLPGVIQSFGNLRAEVGGTIPALKQLGASLVGPAGLFLAFSAVTAAITFAIKEYGSLGNAINALTSSNKSAALSQITFNKELKTSSEDIGAEEAKIKILVNTLTNLKKPLSDRQNAYAELKKIQPDIVRGITEENALTAAGTEIIKNNSAARIQYIKLKAQEAAVSAVINQNVAKQLELETKVNAAAQSLASTREKIFKLQDQALSESQQRTLEILINREQSQVSTLKSVSNEYNQLIGVNDVYLKKLESLLGGVSSYDKKTQDLIETLKKQKKAQKDLTIGNITEGFGDAGQIVSDQEKISRAIAASVRIQAISIDKLRRARGDFFREERNKVDFTPKKLQDIGKGILFTPEIYKQFDALNQLVKKYEETKNALNAIFIAPLTDLFQNFFETGKLSFKSFGDAILKQIQVITSRIIASGIISLLGNLLFPGGAAASGAKGFGAVIGQIFSSFGNSTTGVGGGIANPSFSGVQSGGLSMNGQVNILLRGSDLVGALNRTNSTINRVG